MTVRELFVSLGFEVDEQSEKKVEAAVRGLKQAAAAALEAVNTGPLQAGMEQAAQAYETVRETVQEAAEAVQEGAAAAASEAEQLKEAFEQAGEAAEETTGRIREQEQALENLPPPAEAFQKKTGKISAAWGKLAAFLKKPLKPQVKPEVDEKAHQKVVSTLKGIRSMAVKTLGVIGIGFSFVRMNELAEEFNGVNDMIRNATRDLGDQAEIQQKILAVSGEIRSSYQDTAKIVSNLVQESPDLFGSVDEAAEFAALTTKLFKSTGKSQEEINGLQEAINKSFAKGIVDSETINQLYEKAPDAINMIAESLGVTKEKLAKMATDGTLKVADLKNAFVSNADLINRKFDELDFSISDALLNIRDQWGYWLDQINSTTGLTKNIGRFMVQAFSKGMAGLHKMIGYVERLAKLVGGYGNLLKLVAAIAAGIFVALKADKIIGFLKIAKSTLGGIGSLLKVANLKIMAIAAVVAALLLIVDDFINFMKGNDSVIGSLFEKAGIDADKARKAIQAAWDFLTGFLLSAWKNIKKVGGAFFDGLRAFWERWGGQITSIFSSLWKLVLAIFTGSSDSLSGRAKKLADALSGIFTRLKAVAVAIFNALKVFWDTWGGQISNQFRILWDFLGGLLTAFLTVVQGVIDLIRGVLTGDWETAWQGIKTIFEGLWMGIVNNFMAIWATLYNWFGNIINAIRDTLVNGFNAVAEFMTSLPGKALQWGRDFMDGLVGGIQEKIGAVTDAVSGVADKIKSFLHFSVPDEGPLTDYESWMPDFMTGLAKGIRANAPRVLDAISALTGDMSAFGDMTVKPTTAWSAVGGGSRTTNVHQTNNIRNEFHGGDRAAQTEGAKAMGKTAEDTTAQMARALATGR